MGTRDKRIDSYINTSAPFARPILRHLRQIVHNACPNVEETVKWGMPHFDYNGMMCGMAAFKQHASFGFWKAGLMTDRHKVFSKVSESAMGQLGQLRTLADLPADKILIEYVKEAARLNEEGIKLPKTKKAKKDPEPPDYFLKALAKNKNALRTYEAFTPSNRREYIEWVTEAKTEETRNRRLETAIAWMGEGKIRNWKYVKK